jgi:hypothetical protein
MPLRRRQAQGLVSFRIPTRPGLALKASSRLASVRLALAHAAYKLSKPAESRQCPSNPSQ